MGEKKFVYNKQNSGHKNLSYVADGVSDTSNNFAWRNYKHNSLQFFVETEEHSKK